MCGFVGVFGTPDGRPVSEPWLRKLLGTIRHRGPDQEGVFVEGSRGVAACRLRIQGDERGDQPIRSRNGRVVLAWNGERLPRARRAMAGVLPAHGWEGPDEAAGDGLWIADFLAGSPDLSMDGVEAFPRALLHGGMGAMAVWDRATGTLWLARDRLGIKPLYVVETDDALFYASTMTPLLAAVPATRHVDPEGLAELLRHHRPETTLPFRGIAAVPPGSVWRVGPDLRITRWVGETGVRGLKAHERREAPDPALWLGEELGRTAEDAVEGVESPVLFLSGGLDSGAVAALAPRGSLHALTGRFTPTGGDLDESGLARFAADAGGHPHEVIDLDDANLIGDLPDVVRALEMPMAGPGSLALHRMASRAKERTRVVLTGTGGDELFGGYARTALALGRAGPWTEGYEPLRARMEAARGDLVARQRAVADRSGDLFPLLDPDFAGSLPDSGWRTYGLDDETLSETERLIHLEVETTLPMLLAVEDRILMAHGLEGRPVPCLGLVPHVAAWTPDALRVGPDGEGKVVLRRALEGKLPDVVRLDRRKRGFPTPFARAARGAGRAQVEAILHDRRFRERGWWNADACLGLLDEDRAVHDRGLFALLSWELWARQFLDGAGSTTTQER